MRRMVMMVIPVLFICSHTVKSWDKVAQQIRNLSETKSIRALTMFNTIMMQGQENDQK